MDLFYERHHFAFSHSILHLELNKSHLALPPDFCSLCWQVQPTATASSLADPGPWLSSLSLPSTTAPQGTPGSALSWNALGADGGCDGSNVPSNRAQTPSTQTGQVGAKPQGWGPGAEGVCGGSPRWGWWGWWGPALPSAHLGPIKAMAEP